MIKSIGLFGDSFTGYLGEDLIFLKNKEGQQYHWSALLAGEYGANLTNYGRPGSSLYFSYKQFIEHHSKHDFNIFLITEPGRYIKKVELYNGHKIFIPGLSSMPAAGTELYDPSESHLKGWFLASDDEFNRDMSDLMLSKILEIAPKILIIPCFSTSLSEEKQKEVFDGTDMNLCAMQVQQANAYNIPIHELLKDYIENTNIISGHFVPEFNEIVYKIISKRIKTGVWDWTIPENISLKYKLEEAWIKG